MKTAKEWLQDCPREPHGSPHDMPTEKWVRAIQVDAVRALADAVATEQLGFVVDLGRVEVAVIKTIERIEEAQAYRESKEDRP